MYLFMSWVYPFTKYLPNLRKMLQHMAVFSFVWRDPGVSLKGQISRLPEQPCLLYA